MKKQSEEYFARIDNQPIKAGTGRPPALIHRVMVENDIIAVYSDDPNSRVCGVNVIPPELGKIEGAAAPDRVKYIIRCTLSNGRPAWVQIRESMRGQNIEAMNPGSGLSTPGMYATITGEQVLTPDQLRQHQVLRTNGEFEPNYTRKYPTKFPSRETHYFSDDINPCPNITQAFVARAGMDYRPMPVRARGGFGSKIAIHIFRFTFQKKRLMKVMGWMIKPPVAATIAEAAIMAVLGCGFWAAEWMLGFDSPVLYAAIIYAVIRSFSRGVDDFRREFEAIAIDIAGQQLKRLMETGLETHQK